MDMIEENDVEAIKGLINNYENQKDSLFVSIEELKSFIGIELSFIKDNISYELALLIMETVKDKLNLIKIYYEMIEDITGKLIQLDTGMDIG